MTPRLKIKLAKDLLYSLTLYCTALLFWAAYNLCVYDCFDVGSMWWVFGVLAGLLYAWLWRLRVAEERDLQRRRIKRAEMAGDEWES